LHSTALGPFASLKEVKYLTARPGGRWVRL